MTISDEVSRSEADIQWLDKQIDGLEVKADDRSRLAASLLDMAHEHHKAIVLLIVHKLTGSAFALIRLLFESYIRGVWLHRSASQVEIAAFKAEKLDKKFKDLVSAVETLDGFESGVLSDTQKRSWKALNSFTHGGFAQAVRRITEKTIEANYDTDEIIEALRFSRALGFLTAIAVADLAGNVKLANDVLQRAKQ